KGQEAGSVFAVGKQDDRLAADFVNIFGDDLLEILQGDVDGVVQGRRSARRRLANRLLELGGVVREVLQNDDAAVELDDFGEILRSKPAREAERRSRRGGRPGFHGVNLVAG